MNLEKLGWNDFFEHQFQPYKEQGLSVGRVFRLGPARRRTLSLEIGMQNAGLGTVLALEHFSETTALPAA